MAFPNKHPSRKAFSLVETLVVLTIMAVLAYLTLPALSGLVRSNSVNLGIYDVTSILQLARSEAATRQTYVWVGFSQSLDASGQSVLTMIATSSVDGSANNSLGNLRNLTPPIRLTGVALAQWGDLRADTRQMFTGTTAPTSVSGSNPTGMSFPAYATAFANTVTVTPRGEAMLNRTPTSDTPYESYLDLSFQQFPKPSAPTAVNEASVVIEGGTGMIQTIRVK